MSVFRENKVKRVIEMKSQIRVLVVDDQRVVREGISALIDEEEDIEVIGQAADGFEAVDIVHKSNPDVVLLDLVMPRKDGIQTIREIIKFNAQAKILVLTSFSEDAQIYSAIQAGAMGYLLKDASPAELLEAIRSVYRGETYLPLDIARKLIKGLSRSKESDIQLEELTEREKEILKLIAMGFSNKQIGEKLVISERTVYGHVGNVLKKLDLENRTQAALYAIRIGMLNNEK